MGTRDQKDWEPLMLGVHNYILMLIDRSLC